MPCIVAEHTVLSSEVLVFWLVESSIAATTPSLEPTPNSIPDDDRPPSPLSALRVIVVLPPSLSLKTVRLAACLPKPSALAHSTTRPSIKLFFPVPLLQQG